MNKGILCETCNGKFSPLDALLSRQLEFINGVIGVRPDRADVPRPARVESADGPLTIDHTGKPSFAAPRLTGDEPLPDGRRRVSIECANERQVQEWIAQQKAAGLQVKQERRGEGQRFLTDAIPVQWSFGGNDAFREIGRIALNFLAHRWPDVARMDFLKPFKEWVEGTRLLEDGEPRFVWYAPANAFAVQESPFTFGHQVLLALEPSGAFGRVRFFSTFDLFVWFGQSPGVPSEAVIFDIDPLAEHPPHDLRETGVDRAVLPMGFTPPTTDTRNLEQLLRTRFRALLSRVEDHHWVTSTRGLLESLNATRMLSAHERGERVTELLEPHLGRVLLLARYVAEEVRRRAHDDVTRVLADAMEFILAPDPKSPDGLSTIARASLGLALAALVDVVVKDLNAGPLTDERLRLLLAGGPGAHAVGSILTQRVIAGLGKAG